MDGTPHPLFYDYTWITRTHLFSEGDSSYLSPTGVVLVPTPLPPRSDNLYHHPCPFPYTHTMRMCARYHETLSVKYKGNRRHLAFRYNIFEHLGRVSTLRGKPSPSYPSCFEELTTKTLFEVCNSLVVLRVSGVVLYVLQCS